MDKYMWQRKNYLNKLNRTQMNPNHNELIKFLDRHRIAILLEVYLEGAIAIFKFPREIPMYIYGRVFKLCVRFCVWQLSGKNILVFIFNRSVSNAQFFFCQIYVSNGSNKIIQHTEFSFLPVSKAIKVVSCITDFGFSTAIITFFVGGASWTLDSSIEAANCYAKLTKKFVSVAV